MDIVVEQGRDSRFTVGVLANIVQQMQETFPSLLLLHTLLKLSIGCPFTSKNGIQNPCNELPVSVVQAQLVQLLFVILLPVERINELDDVMKLEEFHKRDIACEQKQVAGSLLAGNRSGLVPVVLHNLFNQPKLIRVQRTGTFQQTVDKLEQFLNGFRFGDDNKLLIRKLGLVERSPFFHLLEQGMPDFLEVAESIRLGVMNQLIEKQFVRCQFPDRLRETGIERSRNVCAKLFFCKLQQADVRIFKAGSHLNVQLLQQSIDDLNLVFTSVGNENVLLKQGRLEISFHCCFPP